MKKVLFIATVVKSHIMVFHIPYLEWFKKNGYEVHVCAKNDYENKEECKIPFCDKYYDLAFERSPFKLGNIRVYNDLKQIITKNNYDIIHSHTPMGGALGRLSSRNARKNGTKVIYTAHGFHFFKGAPLINWLIYYPVEKWLARYTDVLITMNREDYNRALNSKFKAKKIEFVNGVGINLERFKSQTERDKDELRQKYGYSPDDFILIYAGELNYNKHQDLLINVASKLKNNIQNLRILLAGTGVLKEQYIKQIHELGVENNVELLGFRKDVDNLMMLSDIAVSASRREGLPVNVMEAMATGLPLVVTDCRGNRDLVVDDRNGYVVGIDDVDGFVESIEKLYRSKELMKRFGEQSLVDVRKYGLEDVLCEMAKVYSNYI